MEPDLTTHIKYNLFSDKKKRQKCFCYLSPDLIKQYPHWKKSFLSRWKNIYPLKKSMFIASIKYNINGIIACSAENRIVTKTPKRKKNPENLPFLRI